MPRKTPGAGGSLKRPKPSFKAPITSLPSSCFGQLLEAVDSRDRLALFRCCRALRDMVLEQRMMSLRLGLPAPDFKATQAKLLLACKRSPCIQLTLYPAGPTTPATAALVPLSAGRLFYETLAVRPAALDSIKSVVLSGLKLGALAPFWLSCTCPNMITQLTYERAAPSAEVDSLAAHYPQLQELTLPASTLTDEGLEALLTLRHLRRLEAKGFQLQDSYGQSACGWAALSFRELDVVSFDRLPLAGIQSFHVVGCEVLDVHLSSGDSGAAGRVLAAFQARGGVVRAKAGPVRVLNKDGALPVASLVAALPLVAAVRPTHLALPNGTKVSVELLAGIKQHLSDTHVLTRLILPACPVAREAWPLLLPSLPPSVRELQLLQMIEATEEHVIEMCTHACRPIALTVQVPYGGGEDWSREWRHNFEVAMAAVGIARAQVPEVRFAAGEDPEEESSEEYLEYDADSDVFYDDYDSDGSYGGYAYKDHNYYGPY